MSPSAIPTPTSPPRPEPIRVLHLRNTCGYFGAERCIVSWMKELAPRGFLFRVAVFDHPDPSVADFFEAVRSTGAEVDVLPRGQGNLPRVVTRLVKQVRAERIQVIHAHENRSHVIAWLVGGLTATPVVGTVHGYVPRNDKMRMMNGLNRLFLGGRRLAGLTAPTSALRDLLGSQAQLVPNAVSGALAGGRLAAETPPELPSFGVVARLSPEKGIDRFVEAAATLPPEWSFQVAGDGPHADPLRAMAGGDRVEWLGFRADAVARMRDWTALVISSRTEGLPLTLLEAIAQGVPVVATRVGGIPDVLDDRSALLVPPDDAGALAEAMREVVRDPSGAVRRAAAAREIFLRNHTLTRVGDQLEDLYREVAGSPA